MRLTRLRCVSCCARKCILGENMAKYIQLGIYLDVLVEGTVLEWNACIIQQLATRATS